jgi:hypothetical protein
MQTGRHRGYFALEAAPGPDTTDAPQPTLLPHAALLIAYMLPVVVLAEELAQPVNYLIGTLHAPVALGGAIMAVLVATPEAIGAVRAATQNDLQRAVNIFLGSVLATISLTVPAMILVSHLIGRDIVLGLEHTDTVMLLLTLTVSVVTFASGRTNVIQGAVCSFLKKRTKRLLLVAVADRLRRHKHLNLQKSFASFLQKRRPCFLSPGSVFAPGAIRKHRKGSAPAELKACAGIEGLHEFGDAPIEGCLRHLPLVRDDLVVQPRGQQRNEA